MHQLNILIDTKIDWVAVAAYRNPAEYWAVEADKLIAGSTDFAGQQALPERVDRVERDFEARQAVRIPGVAVERDFEARPVYVAL